MIGIVNNPKKTYNAFLMSRFIAVICILSREKSIGLLL